MERCSVISLSRQRAKNSPGLSSSPSLSLIHILGISANFYRMLPYLITLIVLAFTSKSSRAPKAEGIPYAKAKR